jgi:hypothetical protein
MDLPAAGVPDQTELPDLSESSLIELLSSKDPALAESITQLVNLLRQPSTITAGWSSMIDPE